MPKWLCSAVDFDLHFVNFIHELVGLTIPPFYDSSSLQKWLKQYCFGINVEVIHCLFQL